MSFIEIGNPVLIDAKIRRLPACCDAVAETIESGRLSPTVFGMRFGGALVLPARRPMPHSFSLGRSI